MKCFGPGFDLADTEPTPVGVPCMGCNQPIVAGDRGLLIPHYGERDKSPRNLPWHAECVRAMIGER